jgi:hypothetical protein
LEVALVGVLGLAVRRLLGVQSPSTALVCGVGREDGLWEGRGRRGIRSVVGDGQPLLVAVEIQMEAVIGIHGVCPGILVPPRCFLIPRYLDRSGEAPACLSSSGSAVGSSNAARTEDDDRLRGEGTGPQGMQREMDAGRALDSGVGELLANTWEMEEGRLGRVRSRGNGVEENWRVHAAAHDGGQGGLIGGGAVWAPGKRRVRTGYSRLGGRYAWCSGTWTCCRTKTLPLEKVGSRGRLSLVGCWKSQLPRQNVRGRPFLPSENCTTYPVYLPTASG